MDKYKLKVEQQTGGDRFVLGKYVVEVERVDAERGIGRYVGMRYVRSLDAVRTAARDLVLQDILNQALPDEIPVPQLKVKER